MRKTHLDTGRSRLYCACFLLFCLFSFSAGAQSFLPFDLPPPEPAYRNIGTKDGLPSSETYDIHQDKKGYIWIATDRGVVRYDGYRYKVFTERDGLSDNVIFKLHEDEKGRIWFVSFNGLLSYYENGSVRTYRYNAKIKHFLKGATTTYKTLQTDKDDNLYYAIYNVGGLKITRDGTVTHLHRQQHYNGVSMEQFAGRWLAVLWGNTFAGGGETTSLAINGKDSGLGRFRIQRLLNVASSERHAYVQLDDHVIDANRRKIVYSSHKVIGINCIGDDLFIGHFREGVRRMRIGKNGRLLGAEDFLPGYTVSSVMKDREGGYWFTTLEAGVFYTPGLWIRNYREKKGFATFNSKLAGFNGRVYLSHYDGCTRLTAPVAQVQLNREKFAPNIAATSSGLIAVWDVPEQAFLNDPNVRFVTSYNDFYGTNDYVVGTASRVDRLYRNGHVDTLYDFYKMYGAESQNFFYAVMETPSRRIFAGNLNGVFEIKNRRAVNAGLRDPAFRERVIDFAWHPVLGVIAGTRAKGIYSFNEQGAVTSAIDEQKGLLSNAVNCVYVDGEQLIYVGTNNGLNIFKWENGRFRSWTLTAAKGLCSNEVLSVFRQKNELWVATSHGVGVVDMRIFSEVSHATVQFAFFEVDGKRKEANLPKTVSSHVNVLKIGFRTDNYRLSNRRMFRFRLHANTGWQLTANPEIELNEPRAGDYDVVVQFRDDNGEWSPSSKLLRFTVDKPFYLEWYFIVLVFLLAIGSVSWIFKVILQRVKSRHTYQTTINQLKQKALSAQMNPHFIFNSLNSIQSFLVYEENDKAEKYLLTFSSLIRQTLTNSREHYIRLEEELTILSNYLELEQMRFRGKFTFQLKFELDPQQLQYYLPPMLIQPYIENAVVHGIASMEKGGIIDITFSQQSDNRLLVVIDDNGVGRSASGPAGNGSHRSFGTTITQERLNIFKKQLGGEFHVETTDKTAGGKPCGTRIELTIPLLVNYENETTN